MAAAWFIWSLWGVPYLISHHHLSPGNAAALTSCLLIGWAVGAPVFGGCPTAWGDENLHILREVL